MKIIKKTKQFVKENWKPLLTGVGIGCGTVAVYVLGVRYGIKSGIDSTVNVLKDEIGIDLKRPYASNSSLTNQATLADLGFDDDILKNLSDCGFENLDEKPNIILLIQKD